MTMEILITNTSAATMPIRVSLTTCEFAIASGAAGTWRCRTILDLMLAGF